MRRAAFLDRDGVVNVDRAYVHRWQDFEFIPGVLDAARQLVQAGWALVVVTNQSGIARGYYSEVQYQALTGRMAQAFADAGAPLTAVYHCPHHPGGTVPALAIDCDCRKPLPGMLHRAAAEHRIALSQSLLVGDKPSDIAAARAAGLRRAYLVQSDNPESPAAPADADGSFADLAACVRALRGCDWFAGGERPPA